MTNSNEHTRIKMTELDWFIVDMFCKDIIGPRHQVDRTIDPNEEIDIIIQDKIDREGGNEL
jgi:hypothetical protein